MTKCTCIPAADLDNLPVHSKNCALEIKMSDFVTYKLEAPDSEYYKCNHNSNSLSGSCGGPLATPPSFVCEDCSEIFFDLLANKDTRALAIDASLTRKQLIDDPNLIVPNLDSQFGNFGKDEY